MYEPVESFDNSSVVHSLLTRSALRQFLRFLNKKSMCMCVCVHECRCRGGQKSVRCSGAGVIGSWELPSMSAANRILVFYKIRACT